ncbi:beta-hexosaminidase subunit beta [Tetranychus urticae]|uniref:Beta-hexosaminidase n=1 Tax=Tetranychus urticae TaxID=32264 RepID=T1K3H6_TETUR|nr:beta-hexosaminidase subunit beta [Tetranychus urticae]
MIILLINLLLLCSTTVHSYITWIEARVPLQGNRPAPGTPWPLPKQLNQTEKTLFLNPMEFYFTTNGRFCDILDASLTRYRPIIFQDFNVSTVGFSDRPELRSLMVRVDNPQECGYPQLGDDESYTLVIPKNSSQAILQAKTVWGALRGLESFSQLVYHDDGSNQCIVNETFIDDWPEYPYRGMMIDTARHFIPLKILLLNLDAMAYNKLNVFHWHLVDDQAFPLESKVFPELTSSGAYTSKHVYTQEQVQLVIDYARMRGIRVLPEIDSPGHTKVYGKSHPELLTPCFVDGKSGVPNPPHHSDADILNPMRNETFQFMHQLFAEIKRLFKDQFIHLGMDEVYYACWTSNPDIQALMIANNWTKVNQVEQHYVRQTLKNIKDLQYKVMMWQDPVDNDVELSPDSVVEIWKDSELGEFETWDKYAAPIIRKGYRVVIAACWYLNYINYPYPGQFWEKHYQCKPRAFTNDADEKKRVIGGEACLWSEFADGTNILSRIWPRAAAVAERLWTDPVNDDIDSTRFRLDEQRCRLLQRGIPASPILPGHCGKHDWGLETVPPIYPGDRLAP